MNKTMKHSFLSALTALALSMAFTACSIDDEDVSQYYTLDVTAVMPEGDESTELTDGVVTVTDELTGQTYTNRTLQEGYKFQIPGGTYTVTVSLRANDGASVLAFSASRSIPVYENVTLSLDLAKSVAGGLIFKEVYYNMVKPNGKTPYMRDNFYEIYNNSDQTLYLDNCIFGMLEGSQGATPTAWMENGEIMKEYALGYYVVAWVSTTGHDYPVAPGQSIVVASQALNHRAETETMYNPDVAGAKISPVDLTHANFEVCLIDYKPAVALDNPDVPNMPVIYHNGTQNYFNLPYTGNAIILAKLPDDTDPITFANDAANLKNRPDGTLPSSKFLVIPQEYVLDGLNIVNNADKADKRTIRLRAEVDAGILFMEAPYMGLSARRKVESITPDGRVIFKDTNNSSEDFLSDQEPTPFVIPTTIDL